MGKPSFIETGIQKINPFPGIRPFTSAEDKYFFGREGVTSELLDLLQDNRFVALVGASASGKTSLIQSGIIPALITDEKQEWVPVSIHPGPKPVESLVRGFQQVFPKKLKESDVQSFISGSQDLGDLIIEKGLGSHNYFLVVDQFEELFRFGPEVKQNGKDPNVRRFVDLLAKATKQERPGIYVMLSIRSDFIEASSAFRSLTELMNRSKYLLPQMSREALSSSIIGPVQQTGARFEPGFVEYLLDDLDDVETPLPQMQHALMRTWDHWARQGDREQPITISDYQAVGTVQSALRNHLEEAYNELDDNQKLICERLFKSITSKSDQYNGFSRKASLGNISRIAHCSLEDLTDVVETFRQPGRAFLSPNSALSLSSETLIDLAHESLIRIWDRLKKWVAEEDESIKMYLKLSEASARYQQGRSELWVHPELQIAINWRETQKPTPAWGIQYHPAFERAMVFLKTSEEEVLWEEERKVILQKRRLFLNRAIAIFMGVLVVVLGVVFLSTRSNSAGDPAIDQMATQELNDPGDLPPQVQAIEQNGQDALSNENLSESSDPTPGSETNTGIETLPDQGSPSNESSVTQASRTTERQTSGNQRAGTSRSQTSASQRTSTSVPKVTPVTQPEAETRTANLALEKRAVNVAKSVARQSMDLDQDPDLQGLLAYQAFQINTQFNGKNYDGDIYAGLYAALKKLISPAYNIYPNLRNSIKDIQWLGRTGSMIAASSDGSIKILSGTFANRASQITLQSTGQNNECLIVSPDEKIAVVGTSGGGLLFLELENKGAIVHQNLEDGKIVLYLSNLGVSGSFVSAGTENRILKWDYQSRTSTELSATEARPSALAASKNGQKVAFGTRDGKLFELDVDTPGEKIMIGEFGRNHVKAIAYSPVSQTMVVGFLDGSLQVLSGNGRQQLATLKGPEASVTDLAYSPDGRFLAVASLDGKVYMWNSSDWTNPPLVFDENKGFVLSVCFSGNSGYFYSGSVDYPRLIGRPSSSDVMANDFCSLVGRNLTVAEWDQFFGGEIPYIKACPDKN
ncbi:MAG: hypothetical protein V2B15_10160 [Bacteroidota bacterium]